MMEAMRAQGGTDNSKRMADLDEQGVWGEVVFPSLGLWYGEIESARPRDRRRRGAQRLGGRRDHRRCRRTAWFRARRCRCSRSSCRSPRSSAASAKGFKSIFLPTKPPVMHGHWNAAEWEPLWDVIEDTGSRARVPHRHRVGREAAEVPRARRGDHQLRQHHVRRPARGGDDDRVRRARAPPRPEGARVGGRSHLGAVPR